MFLNGVLVDSLDLDLTAHIEGNVRTFYSSPKSDGVEAWSDRPKSSGASTWQKELCSEVFELFRVAVISALFSRNYRFAVVPRVVYGSTASHFLWCVLLGSLDLDLTTVIEMNVRTV